MSSLPTMAGRQSASVEYALDRSEDWTRIDDVQARRRLQNRLAQRKNREFVKQRLSKLDELEATQLDPNEASSSRRPATIRRRTAPSSTTPSSRTKHSQINPDTDNGDQVLHEINSGMLSEQDLSELFSKDVYPLDDIDFPLPPATPYSLDPELSFGYDQTNTAEVEEGFTSPSFTDVVMQSLEQDDMEGPSDLTAQVIASMAAASEAPSAPVDIHLFGSEGSSSATPDVSEPELRFTELILSLKRAGFVDMDSMILEYYSAQFRRDSVPHWLQRHSRQNHLRAFLMHLHERSIAWPREERELFRQSIMNIAKQMHSAPDAQSAA